MPKPQSEHKDAPSIPSVLLPGLQASQFDLPVRAWDVPLLHSSHSLPRVAPWYRPTSQSVQLIVAEFAAYLPESHAEHCAMPFSFAWNPEPHAVQFAARVMEKKPNGQSVQYFAPLRPSVDLPALQALQLACSASGWDVPESHFSHFWARVPEKNPAAQTVQLTESPGENFPDEQSRHLSAFISS